MFAVIRIPDFPLQALLRTEAPGRPACAALIDASARPHRLIACTVPAFRHGVAPGQTASQALARCAALRVLTPRPDAEADASSGLLATAFTVSPFVEITSPGVCTLQLGGLSDAHRETALRGAIDRLRELGLQATAGTGATPLLALYAARIADPLLMPENPRAFLATLPLAAAEPPPGIDTILSGWGLRTLGDLTALSKASVAQRLGPDGLALWERAAGEVTRPLHLVTPPPSFSAEMDCDYEMETIEPLLFLLRRFVDRLTLELKTASLAAAELTLFLKLADETTLSRALRLPEPSTHADVLFNTLQAFLESLRTSTAVTGLRLDITPVRAAVRQQGLFDRALRDSHRFAETLSRIAAIVGSDRIGTPVVQDTHRPDAFTLAAPAAEIAPLPEPRPFSHPARGLVLRRFRPPQRASVQFDAFTKLPVYVRTAQADGPVLDARGPWQASGDWWQTDQHWNREEWDIELDALYRLVRQADGSCFLEGQYD